RGPYVNNCDFNQIILNYVKIGPFEYIQKLNTKKWPTIIIFMQNLRIINLYLSPFKNRKTKHLMWGIGTSSSKGLNKEKRLSIFTRNIVSLFYEDIMLYSKIPFNMYWKINRKKITIIGNSVKNIAPKDFSNHKKNYF